MEQARKFVDRAERAAHGLPPVMPVPWYGLWLTLIAVIELPVMAQSFLLLSDAAPVMAYSAAIAAAVFMVLGAHILGIPLRWFGDQCWPWVPSAVNLASWAVLLGGLTVLAYELRAAGMAAAQVGGLFFGGHKSVPREAIEVLVRISGAVMVAGMLLAVVLSYCQHGRQAVFARAEQDYRRKLRKLERAGA